MKTLRTILKEKGINQKVVADALGVDITTMRRYDDLSRRSVEEVSKISEATGISFSELIGTDMPGVKVDNIVSIESGEENIYTLNQLLKDYSNSIDTSNVDKELLNTDVKQLSDEDISNIAHSLNLQYDDLKYGIDLIISNNKGGKMVPIINTSSAAGDTNIELSGSREGWINIGDLLKDSEGALYVYGNSMIPGYPPGALLGLKKRFDSFIEPGSVYVVQTQTNRYVKRLYYNKDKTAFMCLSDNHFKHEDGPLKGEYFYPPFDIPFKEVVYIWDVTGVIKRNKAIMI